MEKIQSLYVLILAGGGGTRLWPLSREKSPKQFLQLFEGKSLFDLTFERAKKLVATDKIYISTNSHYLEQVKKFAKGVPSQNIVVEPMRRDTALAMGLGAAVIYKNDPEAIIVNLASDHLITPVARFHDDIQKAAKIAEEEKTLVTVGIKPKYPHTGMGHIKVNGNIGVGFVEKPDIETAKKLTASGNYYWNANLYVWKAKVFLDLLKKHAPKTYVFLPKIMQALGTESEKQAIQLAFQMAPSISVDYAVSEKLRKFGFVPASFDWTDIGDWGEVKNNLPNDKLGNVLFAPQGKGRHIGIKSKNNLIFMDKQLVVTIGVEDLLIVDTQDAILICKRDENQAVKEVVKILKEEGQDEYL